MILVISFYLISFKTAYAEDDKLQKCDEQCISFVQEMVKKREALGLRRKIAPVPKAYPSQLPVNEIKKLQREKITYVLL